jgi:hypothetical protein
MAFLARLYGFSDPMNCAGHVWLLPASKFALAGDPDFPAEEIQQS